MSLYWIENDIDNDCDVYHNVREVYRFGGNSVIRLETDQEIVVPISELTHAR
jgi:hypothetical protein